MSSPETKSTSRLDSKAGLLNRLAIAFVVGLFVAWLALMLLGMLYGHAT